jgi:hypothetical protein
MKRCYEASGGTKIGGNVQRAAQNEL